MWILYAAGSSFFAGITAILAKCGIRKADSDVATAIRTAVVLVFSWIIALFAGGWTEIAEISSEAFLFLVLSGLATGASWLCYFRALQKGEITAVVSIDKLSTVLTILLALVFLREGLTWGKVLAVILIGTGTLLMVPGKSDGRDGQGISWLIYGILSAVFASLTAILAKVGMEGVDSNLGTAIRTTVVLAMSWLMVLIQGKGGEVKRTGKSELRFIVLSGLATGMSWLCYYRALQEGPASVVVPVDKLSILVTIVFSRIVFGERLTGKAAAGVTMITAGTVLLAVL